MNLRVGGRRGGGNRGSRSNRSRRRCRFRRCSGCGSASRWSGSLSARWNVRWNGRWCGRCWSRRRPHCRWRRNRSGRGGWFFRRHGKRDCSLRRCRDWFCLHDYFNFGGRCVCNSFIFGTGNPILRRECDAPHVACCLEFKPDLKQFTHGTRSLHPDHMSRHDTRRHARLHSRNFQRDDRVLRNVVLRLILAAVAVHHHRGRAFLERLAKRVDSRYRDGNCLHDPRAPALLCAGIARWQSRLAQLTPPPR